MPSRLTSKNLPFSPSQKKKNSPLTTSINWLDSNPNHYHLCYNHAFLKLALMLLNVQKKVWIYEDCCKVWILERLLQARFGYTWRLVYCRSLDTWKTAARFGYVAMEDYCKQVWIRERLLQGWIHEDCCKVWILESLLQGLDTRKTTASWFGYVKDCCKVWIRERLLQGLDTWKTAVLGVEAWSTPSVGPRWMHTSAACCFSAAWGTHIEILAAANVYTK